MSNQTLKLAVTESSMDDIGSILQSLGLEVKIANDNPNGVDADVLFVNCGTSMRSMNLRSFVENGGVLYVSDLACDDLEQHFPEYISFNKVGETGNVKAEVVDQDLASYLDAKSLDINFDMGSWAKIQINSDDVKTHLKEGSLPLLVTFKHGQGLVVYTSFHNRAQATEIEEKLLRYLALRPIVKAKSVQSIRSMGATQFDIIDTHEIFLKAQNSSIDFSVSKIPTDIQVILDWEGDAAVDVKVKNPEGSNIFNKVVNHAPKTFLFNKAASGGWHMDFELVSSPFTPFPVSIVIGERPARGVKTKEMKDASEKMKDLLSKK